MEYDEIDAIFTLLKEKVTRELNKSLGREPKLREVLRAISKAVLDDEYLDATIKDIRENPTFYRIKDL